MKKSIISLAVAGAMSQPLISHPQYSINRFSNNGEPYKGKGKQRMKKAR